jgi:cell division protein ZapA
MSEYESVTEQQIEALTVNLLNKEFTFRCPKDNTTKLQHAASYLNQKLLEINRGSKAQRFEDMAVMAAISISAELLEVNNKQVNKRQIAQRLEKLQQRIEAVLHTDAQLELSLG